MTALTGETGAGKTLVVEAIDLLEARRTVAEIDEALAALGGDPRARAREVDLLRFQLGEIDGATITDVDEEAALTAEEEALAGAQANRDAGWAAHAALTGDGGAV